MKELAKGVALCPWNHTDPRTELRQAMELLELGRPQIVIIHGNPPELLDRAAEAAKLAKGVLPLAQVWLQIAGDWHYRSAAKDWPPVIELAAKIGAAAVVLNAESYWIGEEERAAEAVGVAIRAAELADVHLLHSAFDQPTLHMPWRSKKGLQPGYPWREFCGPDGPRSLPQVYSVGDNAARGYTAPVGHLGRRFDRYLDSWDDAVDQGVCGRVAGGYLQPYSTNRIDLCRVGMRFDVCAFWASLARVDAHGRQAMRALSHLHDMGYWGPGSIERYQTDFDLTVDGDVGRKTLTMLGVPND